MWEGDRLDGRPPAHQAEIASGTGYDGKRVTRNIACLASILFDSCLAEQVYNLKS